MAEPISSVHDSRIEEFVRLLGENQHRIFVYLMSMMRDRAAVEDVQQETNLVLWREFGSFEPDSNFAAWSFRVAFQSNEGVAKEATAGSPRFFRFLLRSPVSRTGFSGR